eukprot:scaffold3187_cov65-Cylindrotheca_fusiformis.AAC.1
MAVFPILILFKVVLGLLLSQEHYVEGFVTPPSSKTFLSRQQLRTLAAAASNSRQNEDPTTSQQTMTMATTKEDLLLAISSVPPNSPTNRQQTKEIMNLASDLELQCPTPNEQVLEKLQGNWELLWTAQDGSIKSDNGNLPFGNFINPLENQSYSNNPNGGGGGSSEETGRANPFLPRAVQDKLEALGLVAQDTDPVRSSQFIDTKRQQVRNVVSFNVPSSFFLGKQKKASLTVLVDFRPNDQDVRKIDVKFQECRIVVQETPLDITIPLGMVGPTGWLRTGYIDDTIRITRGHKGSVFVLQRPSARIAKQ